MKVGQRHQDSLERLYLPLPSLRASALTSSSPALPSITQAFPRAVSLSRRAAQALHYYQWWIASSLLLLLFLQGKELAAAVMHCYGMSCPGTPEWNLGHLWRGGFQLCTWWWALRHLHYKVPEYDHGCLLKVTWELVQSWLSQEVGTKQTQLVSSNSHAPNWNASSWACLKIIGCPRYILGQATNLNFFRNTLNRELSLFTSVDFCTSSTSPVSWGDTPAPRDSVGVSDTLEGLRALPMDGIRPHTMPGLVTSG